MLSPSVLRRYCSLHITPDGKNLRWHKTGAIIPIISWLRRGKAGVIREEMNAAMK
jgi:hypothetical protein